MLDQLPGTVTLVLLSDRDIRAQIDAGRVRLCCGNNTEQALEPTNVAVHFLGYFRVLVACRATMTTYS